MFLFSGNLMLVDAYIYMNINKKKHQTQKKKIMNVRQIKQNKKKKMLCNYFSIVQ